MNLQNKIIVITGSSSGIGQATAIKFAEFNTKIVVVYKSNKTGAEETVSKVKELGSDAILIQADVSNEKDVESLFKKIKDKYKTIDILINNAGQTSSTPFLDSSKEQWVEQFNTNFFGTVLCSQQAAKIMLENKGGKILNTSSIRGINHTGREGIMAYSAAKAAVNNFTLTLAKELSPKIQVNSIAPGFVYTPNYDSMDESLKKQFIDNTYIKRFINVDEIANGFVFLAQNDAITGEILTIDGGFTLKNG